MLNKLERVKYNLKIKLWVFRGEWFLDTTVGLPYYENILIKNPNVPNIDSIIKVTILDTEDVNEILAYQSDYDNTLRKLTVDFTVNTTFGILSMTEEIV